MTPSADNSEEAKSKLAARLVLGLVDLTSLGTEDTEADVVNLCRQAVSAPGTLASICIWPQFVELAVHELADVGIGVCAVANFPLGANDPELAISDASAIVDAGGAEVDVVIPWRALESGERGMVRRLVAGVRDGVGSATTVKAILETGELSDPDLIRIAGTEAIAGGADFLKTSTGKTARSATPAAVEVLLELVRDHHAATGATVGIKVSGGIRMLDQAREYLHIAESVMGPDWVDRSTFRFGASSLLDDIVIVLDA